MNYELRKVGFLVGIITLLVVGGCGHHEAGHDHGSKEAQGISLDNGKKWEANPETTEGVQNMQELVEQANGTVDEDLVSDLKEEFTLIFKNCTMTGEAHEQLHNFLIPIKNVFEGLESEDIETQESSLKELEEHLRTYSNYFE